MAAFNQWERQVLLLVNAPVTEQNVKFLDAWQSYEGGTARNNPLNTTQPAPGATPYNTLSGGGHVWSYPNPSVGAQATAETLKNNYYPDLLQAIRSGDPFSFIAKERLTDSTPNAIEQIRTWGTTGFANALGGNLKVDTAGGIPFAGPVVAAAGAVTSVADALKFVFSYRFLEIAGGGVLVILGLVGLLREVGGPSVSLPGGADRALGDAFDEGRRQGELSQARQAGRRSSVSVPAKQGFEAESQERDLRKARERRSGRGMDTDIPF